jgi:hypothetical protein
LSSERTEQRITAPKAQELASNVARLPTGDPQEKNTTHYQVIIGGGALFDFKKRINMKDVTDGAANTIMIVEAEDAVPWTKPADLIYDPTSRCPSLVARMAFTRSLPMARFGSLRLTQKKS